MNIICKTFTLSLLLLVISNLSAQNKTTKKVLFVGNSYTYFWNLPQTVGALTSMDSIVLDTRQSTAGGATLGEHWRYAKNLNTIPTIQQGDFDIVILQDHSLQTIEHPDSLMIYMEKFNDIITSTGAETYLYMTWARKWDPYMQDPIKEGYKKVAKQLGAKIVPVGLAWERAKQLRQDIELYDPDGSHPSPNGTYLSACVFYGILTGHSPVGLDARVTTTDKNGEKLYLNILSNENAAFLQKVAEEIILNWAD